MAEGNPLNPRPVGESYRPREQIRVEERLSAGLFALQSVLRRQMSGHQEEDQDTPDSETGAADNAPGNVPSPDQEGSAADASAEGSTSSGIGVQVLYQR